MALVEVGDSFLEAVDESGVSYACLFLKLSDSGFLLGFAGFNVALNEVPVSGFIVKD